MPVACELCDKLFYFDCTGIPATRREAIMKNPSHTCVDCKGAYRTLQQDNVRLTAENSRLVGENQTLRSRLQNLETQFANFKHDIKNEILSEINNTAGSSISREALRKEISSVILEQREQEKDN